MTLAYSVTDTPVSLGCSVWHAIFQAVSAAYGMSGVEPVICSCSQEGNMKEGKGNEGFTAAMHVYVRIYIICLDGNYSYRIICLIGCTQA